MSKPPVSIRIFIAACGFLGAIFLPVWVPIICIIMLALLWRAWEAMLLGLFMDLLWSPPHTFPFFTIGAIVAVWLLEPLRAEFLS